MSAVLLDMQALRWPICDAEVQVFRPRAVVDMATISFRSTK